MGQVAANIPRNDSSTNPKMSHIQNGMEDTSVFFFHYIEFCRLCKRRIIKNTLFPLENERIHTIMNAGKGENIYDKFCDPDGFLFRSDGGCGMALWRERLCARGAVYPDGSNHYADLDWKNTTPAQFFGTMKDKKGGLFTSAQNRPAGRC